VPSVHRGHIESIGKADNGAPMEHFIDTTGQYKAVGINMAFLMARVIGRKYSSIIGFENEVDANTAVSLIKKAVTAKK
jgi:hypothetical protein